VPVDYTPEEPRGARGEDKGAEEEEDPPPQLKEMADIARGGRSRSRTSASTTTTP